MKTNCKRKFHNLIRVMLSVLIPKFVYFWFGLWRLPMFTGKAAELEFRPPVQRKGFGLSLKMFSSSLVHRHLDGTMMLRDVGGIPVLWMSSLSKCYDLTAAQRNAAGEDSPPFVKWSGGFRARRVSRTFRVDRIMYGLTASVGVVWSCGEVGRPPRGRPLPHRASLGCVEADHAASWVWVWRGWPSLR